MYHQIVAKTVRQGFKDISAGQFEKALIKFAPNVIFSFLGDHPLGGEKYGIEAVGTWFKQLHDLFPNLSIKPSSIIVSGWVWNTLVVTHFEVQATLSNTELYSNQGLQILRIRWGKIVEDRLFEDTDKLQKALHYLKAQHEQPTDQ
jgi:ketosteroid isomerase-like protein